MARDSQRDRSRPGYAPTVTSAMLICLAAAISLLGHIRLKAELDRLYADITKLDRQTAEARRFNRKLQSDFVTLTSPAGLSARLREMRSDLTMPGDDLRIVLPEPTVEPALPAALSVVGESRSQQFATQGGGSGPGSKRP